MSLRIIILDYDLTLVNNIYDFYLALNEALEEYTGKTMVFEEFYKAFLEDRLSDLIPFSSMGELIWKHMRKEICRSHYLYLIRGAEYFLHYTKLLGLENIVVTGRGCHSLYIFNDLRRAGLEEYIDEIYTFFDQEVLGGVEKKLFDKSWLLKYIVEKHGVEGGEAVYIGDYKVDYYSSLEAGVEFIGLTVFNERRELLSEIGVSRIARDFYEALNYVIELYGGNELL